MRLLCRNTGTYAETQAAEQLFSYGDFGISRLMIRVRRPNTLAWVMCQNLPTNMVISPMNTKIEMARAEVCRKRMVSACKSAPCRRVEMKRIVNGNNDLDRSR